MLPYALVALTLAAIFGVWLFRVNRRPARMSSRRSRIFGIFGVFAFAILAAGGVALVVNSRAQAVPPECQHLVANNSGSTDLAAPGQTTDPTKPTDSDDPTPAPDPDPTPTPNPDPTPAPDPTVIPANAPIQSITDAQCQALPIYDGANEDAIHAVMDTRGGVTRTYRIAKLADGHCWMLDNLKLGSTTGPITLTPADSDVATDFTLPQLNDGTRTLDTSTNPGNDYDAPCAYGPVPGDTGSGATNYGYLYNFSAATAGETRTSLPSGSDARHDICPANWRLPIGGQNSYGGPALANELANLDKAFGGTGYPTEDEDEDGPNIAKWQNSGPFKGVFSGDWEGGFGSQGEYAYVWSSSASPNNGDDAMYAIFSYNRVVPSHNWGRYLGISVRCLLN